MYYFPSILFLKDLGNLMVRALISHLQALLKWHKKYMYPTRIKALNDNNCEENHTFIVPNLYIEFSFLASYAQI